MSRANPSRPPFGWVIRGPQVGVAEWTAVAVRAGVEAGPETRPWHASPDGARAAWG